MKVFTSRSVARDVRHVGGNFGKVAEAGGAPARGAQGRLRG